MNFDDFTSIMRALLRIISPSLVGSLTVGSMIGAVIKGSIDIIKTIKAAESFTLNYFPAETGELWVWMCFGTLIMLLIRWARGKKELPEELRILIDSIEHGIEAGGIKGTDRKHIWRSLVWELIKNANQTFNKAVLNNTTAASEEPEEDHDKTIST